MTTTTENTNETLNIISDHHASQQQQITLTKQLIENQQQTIPNTETPDTFHPQIHGLNLDPQTRCAHWNSPLDIIAIKMKCCLIYYACKDCHTALTSAKNEDPNQAENHTTQTWPKTQHHSKAIFCGACKSELTIQEYFDCGNRCPVAGCGAGFNPGCASHYRDYFEM